jgi:hypothetical protein
MEVVKTLSPGARGTRRYQNKYAERLVCVRYRKDPARQRRLTTVELIVDEGPLISRRRVEKELNPHPNRHILVKISYREEELRQRAKQAGGKWLPEKRLWQLPYHKAIALGLRSRIVER